MTFIAPDIRGGQPEDQRAVLRRFLESYGLKGLDQFVTDAITNSWSPDRIDLELRDQQPFKDAFPEIEERKKNGLPAVSPADVINYRTQVKSIMFNAGLPSGFYDDPSDFVDLMGKKDLSPAEIKGRVEEGFARVQQAPQAVQEVFNQFFGTQGQGALAAFFLDPQRGQAAIQKAVAQAEVGGFGKQFGFNIDQTRAEQLAAQGVNAKQAFEQANQMRALTNETFTEQEDLTEQDLTSAVFGEIGAAQERVRRRQQERAAQFQGGGGAATTQKGFGLGSSE